MKMKIHADYECCVCNSTENKDIQNTSKFIKCQYHHICKKCFLSILYICYCNKSDGIMIYKCPICRYENIFSNKEIYLILNSIGIKSEICISVHKKCEYRNITKKCKFENCGCRINTLDIFLNNGIDLAIKDILDTSDKITLFKEQI